MIYSDKRKLFDEFLSKWEPRFKNIPTIIDFIYFLSKKCPQLKDFKPLKRKDIYNSQLEWVSLVSQFDNSIESKFFKPFWVPIERAGYDLFIDISQDTYPFFRTSYFFCEPYHWLKFFKIKDLTSLFISTEIN